MFDKDCLMYSGSDGCKNIKQMVVCSGRQQNNNQEAALIVDWKTAKMLLQLKPTGKWS